MAHVDARDGARGDGVGLVVARMKPEGEERLAAAGVVDAIGGDRVFPTVRDAVAGCVERDAGAGAGVP
jgi:hypothetical protein